MHYLILAIYSAGAIIPIVILVFVIIRMLVQGNYDAILCMECDQCKRACPTLKKDPTAASPREIMCSLKDGSLKELIEIGKVICNKCGACEKLCPRGLAPYKYLNKEEMGIKYEHSNVEKIVL